MEEIITNSPPCHSDGTGHNLHRISKDVIPSWGRRTDAPRIQGIMSLGIMVACPLFTLFWYIALQNFDASLLSALFALWDEGFVDFFRQYSPCPNRDIVFVYGAWVLFQAVLYTFLPGKICEGQPTPAGNVLKYKTNGLLASFVTVFFFAVLGLRSGGLSLAFVAEHWGSFVAIFNIYGLFLTAAFYLKAHIAPSHLEDRKFSGSALYDLYMGIELNPRFGQSWDFKLFHNGRPGIIGWLLIDLSFTALQFYKFGYITNSIIITDLLHATYVIDLFYNEGWYIKTIDIAHDHVGFYLAWGSATWLPMMYTLQPQFLAVHPVSLSPIAAASILMTGFGGYALFRSANHQKYLVRDTKGQSILTAPQCPRGYYLRWRAFNFTGQAFPEQPSILSGCGDRFPGTFNLRDPLLMRLWNVVGSGRSLWCESTSLSATRFQSQCVSTVTRHWSTGAKNGFHSGSALQSDRRISYRIAVSSSGKGRKFSPIKNVINFNPEIGRAIGVQTGTTAAARKRARFDSGEDAFFVSTVDGDNDVVAFGVADGVGGWSDSGVDPADFSHALCSNMATAALEWDAEADKVRARGLMQMGYEKCIADTSIFAGGSTASIGVAHADGKVELANLGDSGSILFRLAAVHHYSIPQTHAFNTPYQLTLVPPLMRAQSSVFGGRVFEDLPYDANITNLTMQHGDVLLLATDGVLDNLYNQDILQIITDQMMATGAWNGAPETGINVAASLGKFTQPDGFIPPSKISTLPTHEASEPLPQRPDSQTRVHPLQGLLAATVVRQAKVASMDRHRDGPFAKEAQRSYPWERWRGGKIDDICVVIVVAVEEGKDAS
ncbi:hypothetical protein FQN52_000703 [Onygenales sp. PD_12]|nr:hypothetical protein FQN52_000703 [Onygenales sp. PD_12]